MPIVDILRYGLAAALTLVLLWAAVEDVISRRIPNRAVLATLALYLLWVVLARGNGLVAELAAGALALAVGYAMWAFRILGAGDAKLFAGGALFIGFGDLGLYALATVLAGGVLAIFSLATRPRRAMVMWDMRGRGDFGRGIPYGVPIAFGCALVLWGRLTGTLGLLLPG